jgi:acetylornithine deacetylase/succinyl-diaminopimelate desuccinylase-like protein
VFGAPSRAFGEGGTIPFMGMLGQRFPDAQFVITGVLGPDSNAHGPNEYLHLPTGRKVTAALSMVLDDHARR